MKPTDPAPDGVVRKIAEAWKQDRPLGRVVRNSGYLFASNAISAVLSILTANLLGVEKFGQLGIITSFVSNVNRLLSFRMGDMVVRYMGEYMAQGEKEKAAAIVKIAGLAEGLTSIVAYFVMVLLAPLAAQYIAKDISTTPYFVLFGISILGMLMTETATGVLQVGNHYRSQSVINLAQSLLTSAIFVAAALFKGGILMVLWAYLAGKLLLGIAPMVLAFIRLNQELGKGWWRVSLKILPPLKEISRFALSTNFSGTVNMLARDSELLWIGWLTGSTAAVGYYKTAQAVVNLIIMPINPFIATTYPEIAKACAKKMWADLRKLLQRVTIIAGGWTVAVTIVLAVAGETLLFTPWIPWRGHFAAVYKPEFLPSMTVLFVLLIGYGIANTVYWSRSLLLSFDQADYPFKVSFWAMIVKIILTVLLVPRFGYLCEAALLSGYLLVTVGLQLIRGLRLLNAKKSEMIE
jgi:O-antigen/teichoic acid export membrane protein